jgi:hypothetical protein
MTAGSKWLAAFPIAEATDAVRAMRTAWDRLAAAPKPEFHHGVREPHLTRVLKRYVDRVVGREFGLLGFWSTEGVENEVDFDTGAILDERRTDILYAWNDEHQAMRLVFEFKKLDHRGTSRKKYLGEDGLLRFVTGPYSREQPVAAMVGILTAPHGDVVPPLQKALQHPAMASAAQLCRRDDGEVLHRPSGLFPDFAEFDTEHLRSASLGPAHGTIRVAHCFLTFGYPAPSEPKSRRAKTLEALEG